MAKYFGVGDDVPFEVYITPLDNQKTTGEWVPFPTTPENLRDVFARLDIGPSDWSIANVEAHIYGIRDVIWHCDSLDELNYLAAKLEELDADSIGTFQSVIEIDEHCDSVAELINLTGNLDCYNVQAEIADYDDLGRHVLFDRDSYSYDRNTLDALEDYIDFEGFGRAIAEGEDGKLAEGCYICPSGCPFVDSYDGDPTTIPEEYRVTQMIVVPELTDDERLDKAISLAIDLDRFFRHFDQDYATRFPDAQTKQELICDDLFAGKIAAIDAMLDNLGQGEHDVLPQELAKYKAEIRYDPSQDIQETMTVLVVEPRKPPYTAEIPVGLDGLSDAVGGPIAATYPFDEQVGLICNDEGRNMGLELNRALYDGRGQVYDVIPGTFVIAGLGDGRFTSLPEDLIEKYSRRFQTIEVYAQVGNRTLMFQVPQDTVELSDQHWDKVIQDKLNHKPSIRDKLAAAKNECADQPSQERNHNRSEPQL